ncbi:MAG: N-acetylmuramic acid 6-phosphate etherase [Acidobacteriota bacterium]|nr:N-acetylmuramic acid 6-phosphate etherase [Acidobacteriota bacterium]
MPTQPQTEQPNQRSRGLDRKSTLELLHLLNREDRRVPAAVSRALPAIARAVDAIVHALESGGRLIYAGAGTSGRLGALDASECPPTFGVSPSKVRAVIAGGRRALDHAVEGAEDSAPQGARDLASLRVGPKDVVVGLAASGATPYVAGALRHARRRRATTVLVTTNPRPPLAPLAHIVIVADVGPEALAGSTRLKSGTAQKLILNMLTTAAMARLGRVYDNRMIYVALTNNKLRRRGLRLLAETAAVAEPEAHRALARARGNLPAALVMLKTGINFREAQQRLALAKGHVRRAIESAFEPPAAPGSGKKKSGRKKPRG